jgi:hypothetical protein
MTYIPLWRKVLDARRFAVGVAVGSAIRIFFQKDVRS